MKKFMTLALLTATALPALAMESLPDGRFSGRGAYRTENGESGHYKVETAIAANTMKSTYTFTVNGQDQTKVVEFKAAFDKNGYFDLLMADHVIGEGYCLDVQCHYSLNVGPLRLEETLTFWQGHLYRLGSKSDKTGRKSWQEDLTAVN